MHASKPIPAGVKPRTASPKWVCAHYGIGSTTLYKLMNEAKIRSTTMGGKRLIFVDSVEAILEANASAPAEVNLYKTKKAVA